MARAHGTGTAGALAALGVALALASCGRSSLNLAAPAATPVLDAAAPMDRPVDLAADAPPESPPDLAVELPPDAALDLPLDLPRDLPREAAVEAPAEHTPAEVGPTCTPQPETCNGLDDDCDGVVDDGLPPIPCPDGGERYCVSGRYSECPQRCEVCVPGSERECFTTFCTYWGSQQCASDGRSFGPCQEVKVPFECATVASQSQSSAALEQCCIDHGFCCLDQFDLDKDGDTKEMLGRCDAVTCGP